MTSCQQVIFRSPGCVAVQTRSAPEPGPHEVLVRTECSAISAGSELLALRGDVAAQTPLELASPGCGDEVGFAFPFAYGYAAVGEVVATGIAVRRDWLGRRVVGLVPHASHFVARPEALWRVPETMPSERAAFWPNAETAVALLHDAAPLLGERVLVLGQGIVGLLTAALLARFALARLVTVDCHAKRQAASEALGVDAVLSSRAGAMRLRRALGGDAAGADLVIEVSGDPETLNLAIAACGHDGRVVIGSWYGQRRASLALNEHFHRGRLQLKSSQVSHIPPALRGRWDKERRLAVAADALASCRPERWISHRIPVTEAAAAYQLLSEQPHQCLQVLLVY